MEIVDKMCLFLIAFGFFLTFIQPTSGEEKANTCLAPPEPKNGNRKLFNFETLEFSDVQEGAELPIGSYLKYECNPGSHVWGSSPAICGSNGNWNNIPVCKEPPCRSLVSASIDAVCTLNGKIVSCNFPILHGTLAVLSCRYGFYEDEHDLSTRSNQVKCNERGKWEPEPMQCSSACGVVQPNIKPLTIIKVPRTENSDFPWHASLYEQKTSNGSKDFICGATIITEKLLLTAAHCVYNETNRRTQNPDKYYVAAGNTNRDYDYNQQLVQKSKVKNIYINKAYFGYQGNLAGDIAILEIEMPFTFSPLLLPVCWDDTIIDSGLGKMAGFRRTISGENSFALQSATFPYVRLDQCKSLDNSIESERYKTKDKFCVGYTNGTSVCKGDDGEGLVFKTSGLWYIRGIFSVTLNEIPSGSSEACDNHTYSLYTRISSYVDWIRNIILQSKKKPSFNIPTLTTTTSTTSSPFIPPSENNTTSCIFCPAPPQPENGNRHLHKSQCHSQNNCDVQEGLKLPAGSHLVYNCNNGYKINGTRNVFCSSNGEWINIPVCTKIYCDSLASASTFADCTYYNEWTSCETAILPGTIATLRCRNGYKQNSPFLSTERDQVKCNEKGQWTPDPIKCIPVCGYVQTLNAKPFIANGINAERLPWHATLYETKRLNGPKEFICGATIIKENFLVTAAHCVFDETVHRVNDPKRYYVATGNTFRDYDYERHDQRYVKKARVKHIYVHCNYLGSLGNYAYDIALLEIDEPFVFSLRLLPACLDDTIIESGLGIVAGFGYTAFGLSSSLLQLAKMPYVSSIQCKAVKNSVIYEYLMTNDKFCAGYTNGTSVCDGDSGGGIIFQTRQLWFLRGIVNSGITARETAGTTICDNHSYALYTRISFYFSWIQDIIYNIEPNDLKCVQGQAIKISYL